MKNKQNGHIALWLGIVIIVIAGVVYAGLSRSNSRKPSGSSNNQEATAVIHKYDDNNFKITEAVSINVLDGWELDNDPFHQYDYVYKKAGEPVYTMLASIFPAGEEIYDRCEGCEAKLIKTITFGARDVYLIEAIDKAYPEGRPQAGGIAFKHEDTSTIRLSDCQDKYCPVLLPSGEQLYVNFTYGYALADPTNPLYGEVVDIAKTLALK